MKRSRVRHVLLLVATAVGMGGCAAMVQLASPAADEMAVFDAVSSVDDLFPIDP